MTESDFSEVFNFATDTYNIGWNPCNDLFFGSSLTYKSYDKYDIEELADYVDLSKPIDDYTVEDIQELWEEEQDTDVGYIIIYKFMKFKNITNIIFLNN